MKTLIAAATATLFATSLTAADIYKDLGDGNLDISPDSVTFGEAVAIQPSIGNDLDRYHGFGNGNPDVVHSTAKGPTNSATPSSDRRVVYVGPGSEF